MSEAITKLREVRSALDQAISYLEHHRMVRDENQLPGNIMIVGDWVILPVADWNPSDNRQLQWVFHPDFNH
jgi:hypothetical protein